MALLRDMPSAQPDSTRVRYHLARFLLHISYPIDVAGCHGAGCLSQQTRQETNQIGQRRMTITNILLYITTCSELF